jgi:hypothetical protein
MNDKEFNTIETVEETFKGPWYFVIGSYSGPTRRKQLVQTMTRRLRHRWDAEVCVEVFDKEQVDKHPKAPHLRQKFCIIMVEQSEYDKHIF